MKSSDSQPVYKAYARLPRDHSMLERRIAEQFDALLELGRQLESPFLRELKPAIAVALKWKFDYLAKTLDSPFELGKDLEYWVELLRMFQVLRGQQWFELGKAESDSTVDPWARTAHGFDIGWTTTTQGERFKASREIARERLAQFAEMLGGAGWFKGKEVLDSGCGPGRYIDLLRGFSPKQIVGMDQGPALVEAVRERFRGTPLIEIVRGSCEKLQFPDESFDFVLSNGVLHHTKFDLQTMIADHCRVLRKGGAMFIMLVGKGGLELKIWQFLRDFLYDVPIESVLDRFGKVMSPLRLQGIVDHMYGEYQETGRAEFEAWCAPLFSRIERVPGVAGLDVTPEVYRDDPYFTARFGCGQLRYLCFK